MKEWNAFGGPWTDEEMLAVLRKAKADGMREAAEMVETQKEDWLKFGDKSEARACAVTRNALLARAAEIERGGT